MDRSHVIFLILLITVGIFFLNTEGDSLTGQPILEVGDLNIDELAPGTYTGPGKAQAMPSTELPLAGEERKIGEPERRAKDAQPIGMNWIKIEDWSPGAGCFLNLRHSARHFPQGIPKDPDQWPLVPARSYFFQGVSDYPTGDYAIKVWGSGSIKLSGDISSGTLTATGGTQRYVVSGTPNNGFYVDVLSTSSSDPVKYDIVPVQYENDYYLQGKRFYPPCLQKLSRTKAIRFMDAFGTNGDQDEFWNQRSLPSWYTYVPEDTLNSVYPGLPYEVAFQLVREVNADMWLNIPHKANDNFLQQLAQLAANELPAGKKMYVEISNELWNFATQQNQATALAAANGVVTTSGTSCSAGTWAGAQCWQAYQLARFMDHATVAFGNRITDVKPTIAGQSSNSGLLAIAMNVWNNPAYNPQGHQIAAYAVNPYCCHDVGQNICDAGQANTVTIPTIINSALADVATMRSTIRSDKNTATSYGIPELVAYEGGQHLTAGSCNNNQAFVDKLADANRHSSMEQVYDALFDTWRQEGGGLFMVYNNIDSYSKHGYWGVWEHVNEGATAKSQSIAKRS